MQDGWMERVKAEKSRTTKKQITLKETLSIVKSKDEQALAWMKAAVVGGTIPLSIDKNLGTRHILKVYNNGVIPRGLSYWGVLQKLKSEYKEKISSMRLMLGTEKILNIPYFQDEEDPNKWRRLYGGSHDIWTNRNGQSFTTKVLSYIQKASCPWKVVKVMAVDIDLYYILYIIYNLYF